MVQLGKWIKTALALISFVAGAAVMFGKALVVAVDQGSNFSAIGEGFERARQIGTATVNLGSVVLFLFGAVGVTLIVLYIWRRGPFKALDQAKKTLAQAKEAAPLDAAPAPAQIPTAHDAGQQPVTIHTIAGDHKARAIGIPRQFILAPESGMTELFFRCTLVVDFANLTECSTSPDPLSLTMPNGGREICSLAVTKGSDTKCPCRVLYDGHARWTDLREAIYNTMSVEGVWVAAHGSSPLTRDRPDRPLYCDLEVRIPDQKTQEAHERSGVRMTFELAIPAYRERLALRVFVDRYDSQKEAQEFVTVLG